MKTLRLPLVLASILLMVIGNSCSDARGHAGSSEGFAPMSVETRPMSLSLEAKTVTADSPVGRSLQGNLPQENRMTVRSTHIDVLVKNVAGTMESIESVTTKLGGFVVSSQLSGEVENRFGWMSVRIPTEHLETAMVDIRALAVRVAQETMNAQDVTEEYVDLESRLRVLEETEKHYLRLLGKANTVEEILKVRQAAIDVQIQAEQIKGRMTYLETTAAKSLVTIDIRPATSGKSLVEPGWAPLETVKSAIRGLIGFAQGVVDLLIRVAIFAPIWIPGIWLIWFTSRRLRRRSRNTNSDALQ
jgi:hypothetical protein